MATQQTWIDQTLHIPKKEWSSGLALGAPSPWNSLPGRTISVCLRAWAM